MRRSRHAGILNATNSLDCSTLEPGDIVLCANPRDLFSVRAFTFWSHAGMWLGQSQARAFVDAVNLPVRGPQASKLPWRKVRFSGLRMFRSYFDVLALRPRCERAKREAAAAYAEASVGKPFARGLFTSFLAPREDMFSCASLIYVAYRKQGVDLSVGVGPLRLVPWPSALAGHGKLDVVGRGTRYRAIPPARDYLAVILQRAWFKYVLRKDIVLQVRRDRLPSGAERPASRNKRPVN